MIKGNIVVVFFQIFWYRQGDLEPKFLRMIFYNAFTMILLCICGNLYIHNVWYLSISINNGWLYLDRQRLTLSHIQMISDTSAADIFENIVANREIAHHEKFSHLPQRFQFYLINILSFMEIFIFLSRCFQSRLLKNCCMWERVKTVTFIKWYFSLFTLSPTETTSMTKK